jgi:hypothetical protein
MGPANLRRKAASIRLLQARNIPTIDHLPPLDPDEDLSTRPVLDVFHRMRGNFLYFMRGNFALHDVPFAEFRERLDRLQAWDHLSPNERRVVDSPTPTEQQIIQTSWALEAVFALQWSLGLVSDLPWPTALCDMQDTVDIMKATTTCDNLTLRPLSDLLDQMDVHYRLHWACRESMLHGDEPPGELNESVILERRRALEWLVYPDRPWDDVDLST